jgi:selenocysteine lyase/cysteine desulfurase
MNEKIQAGLREKSARRVYFDNMANTPVDPRVVEAMIPHLRGTYGNPLNIHDWGQASLRTCTAHGSFLQAKRA